MNTSRVWLLPLVFAFVLDAFLVVRYETSAAMRVARAALRTTAGGMCEASVLERFQRLQDILDSVIITDTWVEGGQVRSRDALMQFAAAQGAMTPQSLRTIAEGIDVESMPVTQTSLKASYQAQLHRGVPWVQDQCAPFANPFRSHLRPVGTLQAPQGPYAVYRGFLQAGNGRPQPGQPLAQLRADVWIGIRSDGRVGFEVLRILPVPGSELPIAIEKLFTYPGPGGHLADLAQQPADARVSFYGQIYHDLVLTMEGAERMGSPTRAERSAEAAAFSAAAAQAQVARQPGG
jgi:hypothetical protein